MPLWDCVHCGLTNSGTRNQCLACYQPDSKLIKQFLSRSDIELLIKGYARENEKRLDLFMNIPDEFVQMIINAYPLLLFRIGEFDKNVFNVTNEGTILKGRNFSCRPWVVYADLGRYSDTGFNEGVHLWSVKSLVGNKVSGTAICMLSIGVTTQKNEDILKGTEAGGGWVTRNGCNSFYKGYGKWKANDTVTVKLDCNNWTVTYYNDSRQFNQETIDANKCYYFAMFCCGWSSFTHLQVVDNPSI